ncbi:hypothetical protein DESAMIL20_12 [Desulfurella amilsii]|uniref:Uncharacterized protein n=1 Tax=Desulfurella amilsii TaxID=1562698 RepID=A0A1X4XZG4_9BACT|nr:hypothetical protein DESAMIL20_12 [Desulfurella amilsii]
MKALRFKAPYGIIMLKKFNLNSELFKDNPYRIPKGKR